MPCSSRPEVARGRPWPLAFHLTEFILGEAEGLEAGAKRFVWRNPGRRAWVREVEPPALPDGAAVVGHLSRAASREVEAAPAFPVY